MAKSEFEESDNPAIVPQTTAVFKKGEKKRWQHEADTRRSLAWGIVGSTVVLYAYLVYSVVVGWIDQERFTAIVAALSPLQSLAAATVGFFFAKKR